MAKAKRPKQERMSGAELQRIRREIFDMPQPAFAELIGIAFRSLVRLESLDAIPQHHANHVRCLLANREKQSGKNC